MAEQLTYNFIRVLQYVGTVERIAEARERRQVKGTQHFGKGLSVYEGILGDAAVPLTGQVRLKLCQMIVKADGGMDYQPEAYRAGYADACQELLAMLEFQPALEKNLG